ncbi:hypothetical protein DUNSADRAFT_916, partial [Dunaliella salina]
ATLNSGAQVFSADCSSVFDAETNRILGQAATCSVSSEARETLFIALGGDATILPGTDTLRLNDLESNPLRDILQGERYFTEEGGVIVSAPAEEDLIPPIAALNGPATFREPCPGNAFATVFVDSSGSRDASGRPLENRTYGFAGQTGSGVACVEHDIDAEDDPLAGVLRAANADNTVTLRLENETLSQMQGGIHCLTLTVTNFLNKSSDPTDPALISIEKLGTELASPTIQLSTPESTTIGSGVTLSATVDTTSVCLGEQAEYQWRCVTENCPLLGGPDAADDYVSSVARVFTKSDLVGRVAPGDELEFELSSRMRGADGDTSDVVKVSQSIRFNGDPIVAGFTSDSPAGDISRGRQADLVFEGTGSDESDPSNSAQPMRFSFKCERPDGISACFRQNDDGSFYTGKVDGSEYSIDPSQFVGPDPEDSVNDNTFLIFNTISKGSGDLLRTDTATRFIRLRAEAEVIVSARVDQDCGESCSSASSSSEALSFAAEITGIQNADNPGQLRQQASYRWTMNGDTVLRRHLLVPGTTDAVALDDPVDSSSITVNAFEASSDTSIIPRSGELSVKCTITLGTGANAPSGVATTSTDLVGPPLCARETCLELEPTTSQVPDISFRAEAGGFSASNPVLFEFGFVSGGDLELDQGPGLERALTMQAQDGVGEYTVYVVAVDSVTGGRSTPSIAVFNLTDYTPEGETCEEQKASYTADLQSKADEKANFQLLESTGDNKAIFGGVKTASALAKANANPPVFDACVNDTDSNGDGNNNNNNNDNDNNNNNNNNNDNGNGNAGSQRRLLDQHDFFVQRTLEGLNALLDVLVDEVCLRG